MIAAALIQVGLTTVDARGEHRTVLSGVSLHVSVGEVVAVIGPSGAGKSSVLSCLAGLDRCSEGRVEIVGVDPWSLTASQRADLRADNVALLLQGDDLLPSLTVRENVELIHRLRRERPPAAVIDAALDDMGLLPRSEALPEGLSGGERRRVALARVAVQPPRLTLLDEPTDGLDHRSAGRVVEMVTRRAHAGAGVVVVTHDPAVASRADRVVLLVDGLVRREFVDPSPAELEALFS
jgi:putative ABC transport system ATP-binding protein